jgi:hypothetical protein
MRHLITFLPILLLLSCGIAAAQEQPEETHFYPQRIYPGDNVITITNAKGIDHIRFRTTPNTRVTLPSITGCPTEVNVEVKVDNPQTDESVDFTVYDCSGSFTTRNIAQERWTIVHVNTGGVPLGTDTCLSLRLDWSDEKIIDSIEVTDPRLTVRMPEREGPWLVLPGVPFFYQVCYHPIRLDTATELIRIHIRRSQPNGGLTTYVINKPITMMGAPPRRTPAPEPVDTLRPGEPPPVIDPTTFRNIAMPTAESIGRGRSFVADYDVAGVLGGYGVTDRLMLLAGGVFVPESISKVLVGTVGAKYEVFTSRHIRAAIGTQYAYSSTKESDISTFAPYAVVSLGNRRQRISIAAGYAWKHHATSTEEFNRNAMIIAVGGDVTIGRGWKLAAETYSIESSGIAPLALTARYFTDNFAIDAGLGIDLSGGTDVQSTGTLTGRITRIAIAPILSAYWVW